MRILSLLLSLLSISCTAGQDVSYDYPRMTKQPITETHHGIVVQDDYRNIENLSDSTIGNWFLDQGKLTNTILDTLKQALDFQKKFKEFNNRTKTWAKKLKQDESGNLYYLKRPIGEYDFKVFKKDSKGIITEIYDPKEFRPELENRYQINYFQPSWDGRYIVLSINVRGDFSSELLIIDLKTGEPLDYIIDHVAPNLFNGIHWLPNSKGFTYLRFPVVDKDKEGYKANSVSILHIVGDKKNSSPIFGDKMGADIDPSFFPFTSVSSSKDNYLISYIATVDRFYDAYFADVDSVINGNLNWKKLYGIKDKVLYSEGIIKEKRYYYISPKFNSNFQVLSVDMNDIDFDNPRIESKLPKELVINDFCLDASGIYFSTTKNGVEASLYHYSNNETTTQIEIPFEAGNIELVPNSGYESGLYVEADGWAVDLMRYYVRGNKIQEQVILAEIPEFPEFATIKVEETEIKSHDGVMVPVTLVYDSLNPRSSNKPTVITSYGAYGQSQEPYFAPRRLAWVASGGVIAVAHIRGGGEKGQDWHDAGRIATKSNSWKDIISVTEYLINEKITSPEKTILYSASAGAISSGMAVIERPELFKVFLSQVPFINPSRSSAGSYKKTSYLEFGDIENVEEAKYLLGMDPYLNLKKNVDYPATLIAPSAKDDRLDLWESGKFIARLQEYSTSKYPILLDVDLKDGHSRSSSEALGRLYGFAKWVIEN
ncbi:hypothetical protein FGM00_13610 [Aggregatimonas sangjinii]|uniref:prolyl oligopeptidase n=1 Tax=Aggregatimonas sangjinii TaxID=2583587 RepID=A0A5B7SVY4_9FLAO|nr:prolyl oligopeptidase family serine peptidase [Aggregatimonas sangjinii]QCX01101.1 hypothetical protein FGM00_13610 [Aggregatimonas sangjinii]